MPKTKRAKANPSSTTATELRSDDSAPNAQPVDDGSSSSSDVKTANTQPKDGITVANATNQQLDPEAFVVDFTEVKELEPVADGRYNAVIAAAKPGLSAKGLPKITVTFRILDAGEFEGRQLIETLSLAPTALWKTKAWLVAAGLPDDYRGPITQDLLLGNRCVIAVAMEEQSSGLNPATGEPYPPRPRVKTVLPTGSQVGLDELIGQG